MCSSKSFKEISCKIDMLLLRNCGWNALANIIWAKRELGTSWLRTKAILSSLPQGLNYAWDFHRPLREWNEITSIFSRKECFTRGSWCKILIERANVGDGTEGVDEMRGCNSELTIVNTWEHAWWREVTVIESKTLSWASVLTLK